VLQLGKAAVVSGSVFVIFKVVKTIAPLPVSMIMNCMNLHWAYTSCKMRCLHVICHLQGCQDHHTTAGEHG
jgi:hypothetical protein